LFQNEYFSQELLPIEENQDRKVSWFFWFFLIDLLIFFSDEFDVYNLVVNTSKLKKLKQLLWVISFLIIEEIIRKFLWNRDELNKKIHNLQVFLFYSWFYFYWFFFRFSTWISKCNDATIFQQKST
jgi:hypothetical protein